MAVHAQKVGSGPRLYRQSHTCGIGPLLTEAADQARFKTRTNEFVIKNSPSQKAIAVTHSSLFIFLLGGGYPVPFWAPERVEAKL